MSWYNKDWTYDVWPFIHLRRLWCRVVGHDIIADVGPRYVPVYMCHRCEVRGLPEPPGWHKL